jgi:hypothetical protein
MRPSQLRVAGIGEQGPAGADAQLAHRSELVDRVTDERALVEDAGRTGLDRAPGEVGVLTTVNPPERLGVEAADGLEDLLGIEDVAGLKGGVVGGHSHRARERSEAVSLRRIRLSGALDDCAGGFGTGGEAGLEPVRGRHAVVVGEGDELRPRRTPSVLAGRGAAAVVGMADYAEVQVACRKSRLQHPRGHVRGGVVDDDDLEPIAGERLCPEPLEQALEALRAVVRGHGNRDARDALARLGHRAPS